MTRSQPPPRVVPASMLYWMAEEGWASPSSNAPVSVAYLVRFWQAHSRCGPCTPDCALEESSPNALRGSPSIHPCIRTPQVPYLCGCGNCAARIGTRGLVAAVLQAQLMEHRDVTGTASTEGSPGTGLHGRPWSALSNSASTRACTSNRLTVRALCTPDSDDTKSSSDRSATPTNTPGCQRS